MMTAIHGVIDFAQMLFPVVSEYNTEKLKSAIDSEFKECDCKLLQDPPIEYQLEDSNGSDVKIVQGDIFQDVPFLGINSSGQMLTYKSYGIVLSNTCDAHNNAHILVAPFRLLDDFENPQQKEALISNRNFSYMYLNSNDPSIRNCVIDFSKTNTINLEFLKKRITGNQTNRKYSLSLYGYYLLLIKLSIFLHRPENLTVSASRNYYSDI